MFGPYPKKRKLDERKKEKERLALFLHLRIIEAKGLELFVASKPSTRLPPPSQNL